MSGYYRMLERRRRERLAVKQYHRRLKAEEIERAPLIEGKILGIEWRLAWLIVATAKFVDGEDVPTPEEWCARKMLGV